MQEKGSLVVVFLGMNAWIVVAFWAVVGLIVVLVVTRRVVRTADEALGQSLATPTPTPTSTASPSGQALKPVLQALMRKRATGLLTVTSGNETCSIAILFGHLFHAEYGSVEGEDALRKALAWTNPRTSFDPRVQLPTKETITRAIGAMDL